MKKTIAIIVAIVVVLALVFGYLFWSTNPTRALNAFIADIEAGNGVAADEEAGVEASGAWAYIGPDVKQSKIENIEFFLEDWLIAETIETVFVSDEAWRTEVNTDENGAAVLNKHGFEDKEIKPTPKWLAHHYEAYVDVSFSDTEDLEDGFEDPVIIKMKRQTDNTNSIFAQLFRPWKVTQIKYQPFDDEDFDEIEFDAEDFIDLDDLELEGEDGEFTLEIDDDGEPVISLEDDTEGTTEDSAEETTEETVE